MRGPELGADDPRCPGCGGSVATGQRFCQECRARLPGEGEEPGERRGLTAIFCGMVGSVTVRGREEPVEVFLATGRGDRRSALARPARLTPGMEAP